MKRAYLRASLPLAALLSAALPSAPATAAATSSHHARLGALAQEALQLNSLHRPLPPSRFVGRSRGGAVGYGVFLRGSTSAAAIASTGATPGTVLAGISTADATLAQLPLLAQLPGVSEVDLAGRASRRLDVSIPEIHASEVGHASNAGTPMMWSSNPADNGIGPAAFAANPGFSGDTGSGVVVGVVDTGIDISAGDFRNPDGSTRIAGLWDQPASPTVTGQNPPTGFTYGVECTSAQINATNQGTAGCGPFRYGSATAGSPGPSDCTIPVGSPGTASSSTINEIDCVGHGTHVSGIAAGNGRAGTQAGTYIGVAPQSNIVMVKNDGDLAHIVDGVSYIFNRAVALGQPAVVNLSLGPNEGPHDGTSSFETALDLLTGPAHPGHLISAASGNQATEGASGLYYHASGDVPAGGVVRNNLVVGAMPVFIDIWYPATDRINARVTGPGGLDTSWVSPSQGATNPGSDGTCGNGPGTPPNASGSASNAANDLVTILSCTGSTGTAGNGDNEIQVAMEGTGSGGALSGCSASSRCIDTWSIQLQGASVVTGGFHAWAFDQGDYFFHNGGPGSANLGNDTHTVAAPATAKNVISVGSYADRVTWTDRNATGRTDPNGVVGRLSFFSSRGPTRDGRQGIDIAAPGEMVGSTLSANAGNEILQGCGYSQSGACIATDAAHVFLQGTSMAAPHVTGALALLLKQVPALTSDQARRVLADSAATDSGTGTTPNVDWGAGKLRLGPGAFSLSPAHTGAGNGPTVTICGADFKPGMTVSYKPVGGNYSTPAIPSAAGTNCVSLVVPVSATGTPGTIPFRFVNPDGSSGVDAAGLTVDPAPGIFVPLPPSRILDTRGSTGSGTCYASGGSTPVDCSSFRSTSLVDVQVTGSTDGNGVPSGIPSSSSVTAVVLNVTATDVATPTFLTVYPAGVPAPNASNLNPLGGQTVPNLVTVPVGANGRVSLFNGAGSTDALFDVAGYYTSTLPSNSRGRFQPVVPTRVMDTRGTGTGQCFRGGTPSACTPLGPGDHMDLKVTPSGVTTGVAAVMANVLVTSVTAPSFLTAYPTGSPQPNSSNLNMGPGDTVPNRAAIKVGQCPDSTPGCITLYNDQGNTQVIVDVNGVFSDGTGTAVTGGTYSPVTPSRILDTRASHRVGQYQKLLLQVAGAGGIPVSTSGSPSAAVLNVTVTSPTAPSFLLVYPADSASLPTASDLNYRPNQTVPNLSVVKLSSTGAVSIYNDQGATHVIVDVEGWYS